MTNVRYNISPCTPQEATAFIDKVDKTVYIQRATVKADMRSHYDRYAFTRDDSKVAVVYDTSASVISITAPERFADELRVLFDDGTKSVKRSTVPAQNSAKHEQQKPPTRNVSIGVDGASPDTRARLFVSPDTIRRRPNAKPTTVIATAKGLEISTDEIFPPQRAKRRPQEQENSGWESRQPQRTGYGRNDVHVNASMQE
ncbi:MAG: hypothetical protein K2M48_02990, partial [Clostridiales bacterium]|nr:hypothetical protein [Clostridiales bacterium]